MQHGGRVKSIKGFEGLPLYPLRIGMYSSTHWAKM